MCAFCSLNSESSLALEALHCSGSHKEHLNDLLWLDFMWIGFLFSSEGSKTETFTGFFLHSQDFVLRAGMCTLIIYLINP